MKKSSTTVSPFIILLIPALLIIGYNTANTSEIDPEKQHACIPFNLPSVKGMIKAIF
ncbi:MAG: hypothetical protein ACO1N7_13735 [Sphingobacteriaceae bacterium]